MLYVFTMIVAMEPVGKGRPRSGQGHHYTPTRTRKVEKQIRQLAIDTWNDKLPLDGSLRVTLVAKCRRAKKAKTKYGTDWPTKTPDIDNIAKLILDSLNGLIFHDDAQIVQLLVFKDWGEPSITIAIEQLKEEDHSKIPNLS